MQILDLFCGAGGAAMGMSRACPSAKIIGIDIAEQPEYPFEFIRKNVLNVEIEFVRKFDFVWASPPCQAFSSATPMQNRSKHQNLVPQTRKLLEKSLVAFAIENVPFSPIREDLLLCGEMFGLKVIRHRKFELNGFFAVQPRHVAHKGITNRWARKSGKPGEYYYQTVAGWGEEENQVRKWQEAMEISWITKREGLAQAIPPAYSRYIMSEFLLERELSGQMSFF